MLLKIEVDLTEFYAENFECDPDLGVNPTRSLSDEVAEVVKSEVRSAIGNQVKESVNKMAKYELERFGNERIQAIAEHEINNFIEVGKIKKQYSSEEITINEWLHDLFSSGHNRSLVTRGMEKIGKDFAVECKKRYDMEFESNIVKGIKAQGLLKPGVYEALIKNA